MITVTVEVEDAAAARRVEAMLAVLGFETRVEGLSDEERSATLIERAGLDKWDVEALELIVAGKPSTRIHLSMAVSEATARRVLEGLMDKLGVTTEAGIRECWRQGR